MKPNPFIQALISKKEPSETKMVNTPCQCTGPGNCPRFHNYQMSQRGFELCADKCPEDNPCTEGQREQFLQAISRFPPGIEGLILGNINESRPRITEEQKKDLTPEQLALLEKPTEQIKYPCAGQMALNLSSELAKWIAAGKPVRSEDEQRRIKLICTNSGTEDGKPCDWYDKRQDRCKKCGCGLGANNAIAGWMSYLGIPDAITMESKHCPIGKW